MEEDEIPLAKVTGQWDVHFAQNRVKLEKVRRWQY